jgi:hypothetical protein
MLSTASPTTADRESVNGWHSFRTPEADRYFAWVRDQEALATLRRAVDNLPNSADWGAAYDALDRVERILLIGSEL